MTSKLQDKCQVYIRFEYDLSLKVKINEDLNRALKESRKRIVELQVETTGMSKVKESPKRLINTSLV